ncbi:molybdopterin-dependent oxidoreductase [Spiractinospora alimapuensis]|uniref:molybdopterin-dependent oxidoreductase n=1 Tax=Spiractinospora alimapuensis TaxID=2820884 RepID=UPI002ED009B9
MDIVVNGSTVKTSAEPDTTAVEVVREDLGLTGAKLACGNGVCGACTVLVDGSPTASCLLPATALADREITTVEGLGGTHPAQRAFAAHDAMQCGYCTPGFVVEAAAFVDRWRAEHGDVAPDRATIADAMAGHLCRCGAYEGIYAAVASACRGEHDTEPAEAPPRAEAKAKVTGTATYTTDVYPDGYQVGIIVRAAMAHARVRAVDSGGAPLVDLLGEDRTVRYVGQPIAAVAAPTRAKALAAAEAVTIDYEPRPAVFDLDRAQESDAPVVYPNDRERRSAPSSAEGTTIPGRWSGNLRRTIGLGSWRAPTAIRRLRAAAKRGDPHLLTAEFSTPVQLHTAMEPHACVAWWDENGGLHLHLSTQTVAVVAEEAAKRWGLDPDQVRVVAEHVGGGFGAKSGLTTEAVAAAELARATGAPVRVVLSRSEELTDTGNRPGTRTRLALLARPSGRLAALGMDVLGDGGVSVSSTVAIMARLIYGNAPRRIRDFDVTTNLPPGTPFRGPGAAPMLWALEQGVDEVADRLKEDPVELRRRWDGNPKRHALYDWVAALPAWQERSAPGSDTGRYRRGIGVSTANWQYMVNAGTEVKVTVERGTVVARTATQDIGTGIRSVVTDILRDELGLPAGRVRVDLGHSRTVHGPPSVGSQTTTSVGPAARDAADKLRAVLRERAPENPPSGAIRPESLDHAEGVEVVGVRQRDHRGYVTPFAIGPGMSVGRGFAGAVTVTEVEVDTRLGQVRPTRAWMGISAGRIYSPRLARNQCEGGIVQGIGYALYEERRVDPGSGVLLSDDLEEYRIPGIGDTPETVIHFHEDGWDHVTGGGVGLGEVSTVGVAASIVTPSTTRPVGARATCPSAPIGSSGASVPEARRGRTTVAVRPREPVPAT